MHRTIKYKADTRRLSVYEMLLVVSILSRRNHESQTNGFLYNRAEKTHECDFLGVHVCFCVFGDVDVGLCVQEIEMCLSHSVCSHVT